MSEGIEAITLKSVALAMDAAILRQQAIAANIANVNTTGYTPLTVNFESQMESARLSLQCCGGVQAADLADVAPSIEQESSLGLSPKVMIDVEVAKMTKNAVQFQLLTKGLSRHFSILSAAVSDGKK